MFIRVIDEKGNSLGRKALERETRPLLYNQHLPAPYFYISTHLGKIGLRSNVRYAEDVRQAFRKARKFAMDIGYQLLVEVNAADSRALATGGFVSHYGVSTTYLIRRDGGIR